MCIIIDTNTLASVFNPNSQDHPDFQPVLDWIIAGRGKIVLGGTKYGVELKMSGEKIVRVFREFLKRRKIINVSDSEVDREEIRIKTLESSTDFDDAHIVALLDVSGCMLICSKDKRAFRFFKKMELYKQRAERPKIYHSQANADLLCDANIAPCCEPTVVLNRTQRESITAGMPSV
jgi:predicted nucleic acid-binding protein